MESAIDKHLVCPRTLNRNMAEGFTPPFQSTVSATTYFHYTIGF